MSSDLAIRVEHLSKRYRIGTAQTSYPTLRDELVSRLKSLHPRSLGQRKAEEFIWALDDVSFEVKQGEVIGIIGRNGAGKSTLLKILAHITRPTRGRVEVHGRVGSLLEVGTGFHPELTGRENIYLNGAILGMKQREIDRKFDEIVAFSEVEKFLDTPMKHYSSGMYMRLAFAVAAHLEPEILLVDEVLAVGDAQFQKKCLGKMGEVAQEGRTVLFVSHNMGAVQKLCKRALLINMGKLEKYDFTHDVVATYLNMEVSDNLPMTTLPDDESIPIQIKQISVCDQSGKISPTFSIIDPIYIEIYLKVRKEIAKSYLAAQICDTNMNSLIFFRDFEHDENHLEKRSPGCYQYKIKIPAPLLIPGKYLVSAFVVILGEGRICSLENGCSFQVIDTGSIKAAKGFPWSGLINPNLEYKVKMCDDNEFDHSYV